MGVTSSYQFIPSDALVHSLYESVFKSLPLPDLISIFLYQGAYIFGSALCVAKKRVGGRGESVLL